MSWGRRISLALWVGLMTLSGQAAAETRYVSDVLTVNLRERPDTSSATIRLLRTADSLEVLETVPGFIRVRAAEGEEGWVAEQYVTGEVPKEQTIRRLEQESGRLRQRVRELEETRDEVTQALESARTTHASSTEEKDLQLQQLRGESARLARELKDVSEKYEGLLVASKDVLQVIQERDRLLGEAERLGDDLRKLQEERSSLVKGAAVRWFLAGAGVLLTGWLLGAFSGRRKKARFSVG